MSSATERFHEKKRVPEFCGVKKGKSENVKKLFVAAFRASPGDASQKLFHFCAFSLFHAWPRVPEIWFSPQSFPVAEGDKDNSLG